MAESLENQFISDRYTSLLHLSGATLTSRTDFIYDGLGNKTPIEISTEKVVATGEITSRGDVYINNVEMPSAPGGSEPDDAIIKFIDLIFPVNSVYLTTDDVSPATRFPNTEWELIAGGRYLIGVGEGRDRLGRYQTITSGSDGDSVGEYKNALKISEMPNHDHMMRQSRPKSGQANTKTRTRIGFASDDIPNGFTTKTGGSQPHNNMPPYFGVYTWKRKS